MAGPSVSKRLPVPVFLTTSAGVDASDTTNNANKVTLATALAGEDVTNDVTKVEQRFAYSLVTSGTSVKSAPGFLHTVTFACADATPTAGTITIYDNTAASGTKIFEHSIAATAFLPFSILLDVSFTTGLYVDFTTTADVNVTVSYR